jgi:adenylosuccinate synthase
MLEDNDIDISGLKLASTAHVTMPYHRLLDMAMEQKRGLQKIGTTGRGIGPTYADKSQRNGIRIIDLLSREKLQERLKVPLAEKNGLLEKIYGIEPLTLDEIIEEYLDYGKQLKKHIVDCNRTIHQAARKKKNILFEGAQGTLLDLDHGTYPYVTSSNPVSGGACIGAGVGPTLIDRVIGVAKAYTTRVGEGPFPTELQGSINDQLCDRGGEFGTTTGRRRRCGWFDGVIGKYAVEVNGLDCLAITKLDVLDELDEIHVCVAYELNGEKIDYFPSSVEDFEKCTPIFKKLPGWKCSTENCRRLEDLPPSAMSYLRFLAELMEVPIAIVSLGANRDQTIVIEDPIHGPKRALLNS